LSFPRVTDPGDSPLRTERHLQNSITTLRRRLIVALSGRPSAALSLLPRQVDVKEATQFMTQ
jgi:hypothetical protein